MSRHEAVDRPTRPGVPSSLQELYDLDTRPVPDALRADSHPDFGLTGIARDRYLSREFHHARDRARVVPHVADGVP